MRAWLIMALTTALLLAGGRAAVAVAQAPVDVAPSAVATPNGAALFRARCAPCHGVAGRGDGPDATLFVPAPRDLREGFLQRYDTVELVRRVREGKPLELALDLPALRARATDVEAIAAHLEHLPSIDWRLAELGQEIFVDRCEICHGPFGKPGSTAPAGVRPPRDLSDPAFQRGIEDAELLIVARHGRRGMPAISPQLSEADGKAVVAFVRMLSPGFEQYSLYCAACHGDDGRGTGSLGEARGLPAVVFDRQYFVRRDQEQVRAAVWHMMAREKPAMPHFRNTLDESEARAIVDYLKHRD